MSILAQYIWIDGTAPTQSLRGKTRVINNPDLKPSTSYDSPDDIPLSVFPEWGADGSSTNQAEGDDSDIKLVPVYAARDPYREGGFLVLCEVYKGNGEVHSTNNRAQLRKTLDNGGKAASKTDDGDRACRDAA